MSEHFGSENFPQHAVESVIEAWFWNENDEDDTVSFGMPNLVPNDLFVVWFTFVLGNWKALISTHILNGHYWEVTYNREKGETYVDKYIKQDQVILEDGDDDE